MMPLLIELFLLLLSVFFLLILGKNFRIAKLEKRFNQFSLLPKTTTEIAFFDEFASHLANFIRKLSTCLKKSSYLVSKSKRYEKYIPYAEKDTKESIDFLSTKILIALLFGLFLLITSVIKPQTLHIGSILITLLLSFYLLDILLFFKFRGKQKKVEEDLLKAIIIMNNSFKAGRNIMQAIITVKNELDGPIADEFKKIYLDITYGLSLEVVFNRFYERVKLEDAKYIASSLTLLSKTGGNIVKVFNSIEKSFYNKKKLNNELKSLTSASVFVYRVLVALPFIFTCVILLLNPTYFNPLFKNPLGICLLLILISLFILYVLIIKKVLKVKM